MWVTPVDNDRRRGGASRSVEFEGESDAERVPEDRPDFRPHPKSMTLARLAGHVAEIPPWVMNHLIHHRAQLAVYLRMNDVPVPSIYGLSADEGSMWRYSSRRR